MFRDIPIGLNEYVNEKCKKSTEKSWLTDKSKLVYNKGTKRQYTPVSGFQVNNLMKNSHYAWWAGWLFFCTCNHNDKYSKRNHQRKCLICTHVIPPPFGDGSNPAVGTAYTHYTKGLTACKGYKWKPTLVYWTNL